MKEKCAMVGYSVPKVGGVSNAFPRFRLDCGTPSLRDGSKRHVEEGYYWVRLVGWALDVSLQLTECWDLRRWPLDTRAAFHLRRRLWRARNGDGYRSSRVHAWSVGGWRSGHRCQSLSCERSIGGGRVVFVRLSSECTVNERGRGEEWDKTEMEEVNEGMRGRRDKDDKKKKEERAAHA